MNESKRNVDFIDFDENSSRNDSNVVLDLLTVLWRNRFWFFLSIVLALFLGVLYVRSTQKTYSRKAVILIKDDKKGGSMGQAAVFQEMLLTGSNSVANEIGVLKSRHLMKQVVQKLNLTTNYKIKNGLRYRDLYAVSPIAVSYLDEMAKGTEFSIGIELHSYEKATLHYIYDEEEKEKRIDYTLGEPVTTPFGTISILSTLFLTEELLHREIIIEKRGEHSVTTQYKDAINIFSSDKQSSLVEIELIDTDTERADDIIDVLIRTYELNSIEEKNSIITNTVDFIDDKLIALEKELQYIDTDIEEYKKTHKLTDIDAVSSMYLQSYSRIDAEALGLENQLSIAKYMKEYLQDNANVAALIPSNLGINNIGIEGQIAAYNENMALRTKLMANSSENNPYVKDLQVVLMSTRTSIVNAIDNLIAGLEIQIEQYKAEEKASSSMIANVPTQHKFMVNIERQLKIKEELYLYLLQKKEESEIQKTTTESNCTVVDYADGYPGPVAPNKMQVVLISFVLGFLFPAVVIYIRTLLSTSVYTKKDITDVLDIPYVGELPLDKSKGESNIVVEKGSRNEINEAFRLLRDNIELMYTEKDSKGKVVLITSLNPGSGKTFITSNLSVAFASTRSKVVLVDIDLRKASLTKRLNFDTKLTGLSAYLAGKVENIEDVIRPFKDTGLDVVTSGALPPNPADLLKYGKTAEFFEALSAKYDYIIIDTAPYGMVSDAALCAQYADFSIMVVRSGLFDKRQLPHIDDVAKSERLPHLGVLLNGIDHKKIHYAYGYGNGYGYGYGYGYGGYGYGEEKKKGLRDWIRFVIGV